MGRIKQNIFDIKRIISDIKDEMHFGDAWNRAESRLYDATKNLLTLSSTSLVLTFSAAQLTKVKLNFSVLILSWISFLLVILFCSFILFLSFFYQLNREIIMNFDKQDINKLSSKEKDRKLYREIYLMNFYFTAREWLYFTSLLAYIFFILGIGGLIISIVVK